MDVSWELWQTFVSVLNHGSFSDAARELGVGQSTVSRRIGALEEESGSLLFVRRREGALPTPAAEALAGPARAMANGASELLRVVGAAEAQPTGIVRLAAPPGWAVDVIAPKAAELRARLPGVRLELRSGVDYLDLMAGEADLAVRTQPATQRGLMELARVASPVYVYASPAYAAGAACARHPAELDWVTWDRSRAHLSPRPELERLIPGFQPAFASDSFVAQCRAVTHGAGAMFLSSEQAALHGLVRLDVRAPRVTVHTYLVTAKSAYRVARVRAVAEALLDLLETDTRDTPSVVTRAPR